LHKNNIFNTFFIVGIILTLFFLFLEQINNIYGLHMYAPSPVDGPMNPATHNFGKFVVYENSTIEPETELKGIVVDNDGGAVFIVPDDNYRNLITFGNIIYPEKGQKGYESYVKYVNNYKKAKGIPQSEEIRPPIIKLETYGFCKYYDCTDKYKDGLGEEGAAPILRNPDGSFYMVKSIITTDSPCYPIKLEIEDLQRELEILSTEMDYSSSPGEKRILAKQIQAVFKEIKQKQDAIKQCIETNPSHTGNIRQVQAGDHIKIEGLYAIDNSHPMVYGTPSCQEKFEMRIWPNPLMPLEFKQALPKTVYVLPFPNPLSIFTQNFPWPILLCYNHAELHPYKPNSIRLIEPLKPGDINKESHIVVAPVPTQFVSMSNYFTRYSWSTYGEIDGPLGGRLVDFSTKKLVQSEFFMEAPPKPVECNSNPCVLQFKDDIKNAKGPTSDPFKDGYIEVKKEFTNNPDGVKVIVTVKGEDLLDPTIYSANFSVWWEVGIIG
jgi:hypothetical protein